MTALTDTADCHGCGNDYPLTAEYWPRHKRRKSGFADYCKPCNNKSNAKRDHRDYALRRRYGITRQQFDEILAKQHHRCKSCGDPISVEDGTAHYDHDHATGKYRGILCASCNKGLGCFKDSPTRLAKAIWYLVKHN